MKVAILSNDFRVYWKGRLTYLQPFLMGNDIDLHAVELFGKGSPYTFDSYHQQYGWWKCLFPNKSARELSKQEIQKALFDELDAINPDIIIASPITFYAGALGLRWAKHNHKKYIMFDDAKPLIQFKRNFVVKWVRDTLTAQLDALWLPSPDYGNAYPALANKRVHFFYGFNTIDNSRFKLTGTNRLDNKVILCVARLVPIKNIDSLLKAWQVIEQKDNEYKLIIIGNGPDHDALVNLSTTLNLKRVEFAGFIANEQIPAYYHSADAFILASLSETWGLVVNEAMAAGLPVLLSNRINATHSLLTEGVNGYSFDPYDVDEIEEAILKYINLPVAEKEAMSTQALKIINDMDYAQMGKKLLEALQIIAVAKFKKPGIIATAIVNLWYGKHDTSAWDNV